MSDNYSKYSYGYSSYNGENSDGYTYYSQDSYATAYSYLSNQEDGSKENDSGYRYVSASDYSDEGYDVCIYTYYDNGDPKGK